MRQKYKTASRLSKGLNYDSSGMAKVIQLKISWNIEDNVALNQDTRCIHCVKRTYLCISILISGTAKGIKLKFSEYPRGNVKLNQKILYTSRLLEWHKCNISRTVKGIKLKLSENFIRDFELKVVKRTYL